MRFHMVLRGLHNKSSKLQGLVSVMGWRFKSSLGQSRALCYNGLRPFSIEEGFFFVLSVGALQQKCNRLSERVVRRCELGPDAHQGLLSRERQFASCFRIRLARISFISRWRGTDCETPVVGLRYQSCLPRCRSVRTHDFQAP